MEKKSILGTGLTGLVGSRLVELLQDRYEFENCSRSTGIDITSREQIRSTLASSNASIVLHLAAKADVDGCEADKGLGEEGEAWKINVLGTQHIAEACAEFGKKLIYISTDFVFNGTQLSYTEDDLPDPVNWYARTKYEGEKIVQSLSQSWIIVRPAYPYRTSFTKLDFMRAIKNRLEQGQPIKGVTDHIFCPTYIDDFAFALDTLVSQNTQGIYHVVGGQSLSPYEAALLIAETFSLEKDLITPVTREEFFNGRAARPFRLALKHDKITSLGVTMKSFSEGLQEIKNHL